MCCSLSALVVQSFFAWRIWHVSSGNIILPAIVVLCSTMQMGQYDLCGSRIASLIPRAAGFLIYVLVTWGKAIAIADIGIVCPKKHLAFSQFLC